jgi:BMFP domain-containing protein YqiC
MLEQLLKAISEQISAPKADFEKNLRAWLEGTLDRLDIVTRDQQERQAQQLADARLAIKALEQQVAALEQLLLPTQTPPTA